MTKSDWAEDPWRKWYGSNRWKRRRLRQLTDEPLCHLCLGRGIVTAATVADHIEPHRGDWNQFLTSRLQSLCADCHNKAKRSLEDRGYLLDIGIDGWPVDPQHPANRKDRR